LHFVEFSAILIPNEGFRTENMNEILVCVSVISVALLLSFGMLFQRMIRRGKLGPATAEWLNELGVGRYRPMERLLKEDDYRFLASHRGFRPQIARRLRAERRKIFRGYLRALGRDFTRLTYAMQMLMLNSPQDRPDLAASLMKQKLVFTLALMAVQIRLAMHALGLATVDVRGLLESLDAVRFQFQQLSMTPTMSAVSAA
jgi:hypothetical protein